MKKILIVLLMILVTLISYNIGFLKGYDYVVYNQDILDNNHIVIDENIHEYN